MLFSGPRRLAVIDGALIIGITVVAHTLSGIGYALLSGVPPMAIGSVVAASALSSWPVFLAFTLLTGLIAISGWTRRVRLRLAVPAALVAWLAGQAVLGLFAGMPLPDYLLWSVFQALPFVLAAFVAGLITSAIASPDATVPDAPPAVPVSSAERSAQVVPIVRAVALGVAVLLTVSLPWQWFQAYFQLFGGSERVATAEQGWRYLATVVAALVLTVLAAVLAIRQRRGGAIAGAVVMFCVVVVVAFVCQVPRGTLWIDPPPAQEYEVDPQWQECAWDANKPGCGG
jgi:hypothetical protein